jgi:hypothetical protein
MSINAKTALALCRNFICTCKEAFGKQHVSSQKSIDGLLNQALLDA